MIVKKYIAFALTALLLSGLFSPVLAQTKPADADPALWARAMRLHRSSIVVDGHNDITSPMVDEDFHLSMDSKDRLHLSSGGPFHTDLDRMLRSGVTGNFFAIYVSGNTLTTGGAMRRAMDMIDATNREIERHPRLLSACSTSAEIRAAKIAGKRCILMGIEGGYAIENSLYALRNFYRLGIRYMTLTHNVSHDWADAHRGEVKSNGLSDFGKEVVREMNRLGMLVDISHVSDKVMHQVLDISTAPIIASHSGVRGVANHTRNVPDDVLVRLKSNGGVIMVVYYPTFLDEDYAKAEAERADRLRSQVDALREQYKSDQAGFNAARRELFEANPIPIPSYTRIVDHIDHIKKVAGIDHVGLGSDYDGVPLLPAGMNGMEDKVLVTYEMLRRGYTETEVRKVLGLNFLRAFSQAERAAKINTRKISRDGSLKKLK
jgi:membrane dipeptidase